MSSLFAHLFTTGAGNGDNSLFSHSSTFASDSGDKAEFPLPKLRKRRRLADSKSEITDVLAASPAGQSAKKTLRTREDSRVLVAVCGQSAKKKAAFGGLGRLGRPDQQAPVEAVAATAAQPSTALVPSACGVQGAAINSHIGRPAHRSAGGAPPQPSMTAAAPPAAALGEGCVTTSRAADDAKKLRRTAFVGNLPVSVRSKRLIRLFSQ